MRKLGFYKLLLALCFCSSNTVAQDFSSPIARTSDTPHVLIAKSKTEEKDAFLEFHHFLNARGLLVRSRVAMVADLENGKVLYGKNINEQRPIASLTKLMTAIVVLDARQNLKEKVRIVDDDRDFIKFSRSRLRVGTDLPRRELLYLALAQSENRAAHALARNYPGGTSAFIKAMNRKAKALGMSSSHFADSSGLSAKNVSSARDLVKLVSTAYDYEAIQSMTTTGRGYSIDGHSGRIVRYRNTNRLVRGGNWDINISKTGFINEAGYCLVMHATIANKPIAIVLLQSSGKFGKYGDAQRIREWLMEAEERRKRYKSIVRKTHS